jgi:hypothetical protein
MDFITALVRGDASWAVRAAMSMMPSMTIVLRQLTWVYLTCVHLHDPEFLLALSEWYPRWNGSTVGLQDPALKSDFCQLIYRICTAPKIPLTQQLKKWGITSPIACQQPESSLQVEWELTGDETERMRHFVDMSNDASIEQETCYQKLQLYLEHIMASHAWETQPVTEFFHELYTFFQASSTHLESSAAAFTMHPDTEIKQQLASFWHLLSSFELPAHLPLSMFRTIESMLSKQETKSRVLLCYVGAMLLIQSWQQGPHLPRYRKQRIKATDLRLIVPFIDKPRKKKTEVKEVHVDAHHVVVTSKTRSRKQGHRSSHDRKARDADRGTDRGADRDLPETNGAKDRRAGLDIKSFLGV